MGSNRQVEYQVSKRGAIDLIFAVIATALVGVTFTLSQMTLKVRSDMATKYLLDRALAQANQSTLEIANAGIRSGLVTLVVGTGGSMTVTLPKGPVTRPNWNTKGTTLSNFTINVCTPLMSKTKTDLAVYTPPTTQPCTATAAGKLFSTLKIKGHVKVASDNFIDVTSTTTNGNSSKTLRALLPIPLGVKKKCSVDILVNNKNGCGPSAMMKYRIFIPGGNKVASSYGQVISSPPGVLRKEYWYGRKEIKFGGCSNPGTPPNFWLDPTDGVTYDIPNIYRANGATADCDVAYGDASPLLVDLSNQGLKLSNPEDGPLFDMAGDNVKQRYAWPRNPETYFLSYPSGVDGQVKNIHQLFGNETIGPDGEMADNGFDALKKHVKPGVEVLNASSPIFKKLRLWADRNGNGQSEPTELFTLKEKGIVAINLKYQSTNEVADIFGSHVLQRSTIVLSDKSLRPIVDLWPAQSHQEAP